MDGNDARNDPIMESAMRDNRPDWRTDLMRRLRPAAKFFTALATSVVIAAGAYTTDGKITGGEWLLIIVSCLGSGAVWAVPNAENKGRHEAMGPVAE
jgi:hypothetical protein